MSRVIATGSYLPDNYLTNEALIQLAQIDSSDEWIKQRTGIQGRHFISDNQTVADLAIYAAKKALEKLDRDICHEIKHIIVASMSSQGLTPNIASHVQGALKAKNAWGFDLNSACNGFITAVEVANQLACSHQTGYTLVIGAEAMSQIIDLSNRSVSILFGDGAGAILIQHDGAPLRGYRSQLSQQFDDQGAIQLSPNGETPNMMEMNGRSVFNFVNRTVINDLCTFLNGGTMDYLISHQANERLLDLFAKKLRLDESIIPRNIHKVGNLSAASIPVLIDEMVHKGYLRLDSTQKVVLAGFGGGLSWGFIQLTL